jgi:hypothetical protein
MAGTHLCKETTHFEMHKQAVLPLLGPHHSEQLDPSLLSCRANISHRGLHTNLIRNLTVEAGRMGTCILLHNKDSSPATKVNHPAPRNNEYRLVQH